MTVRGGVPSVVWPGRPQYDLMASAALMVQGPHGFLLGMSGFSQTLLLIQETEIFLAECSQAGVGLGFEPDFNLFRFHWESELKERKFTEEK